MALLNAARPHGSYTVGWICALPKEQTAAILMLDTRHPDLPRSASDANAYILGSIGLHNVVITCLPISNYGTSPAATAVARMRTTFPSLKIAMMVGIGAGIPPKVKLGDVVISTEWTQWDFGKEKEGVFEHTSKRYYPPDDFSCAMSLLQAEHDVSGIKIQERLDELRSMNQRLPSKYTSVEGYSDTGASDNFQIHYGLIASGNRVVKDAGLRSAIDKSLKNEVLCIEMEAGGLRTLPAVIIRGICDFADETKNDAWQEYAATVAAICAKDLLKCVQPTIVDSTDSMHQELKQLVAGISIQKDAMTEEELRQMISSLPATDFNSQQDDLFKSRQHGTGQWFLDSPEYQNWLDDKAILFCPGIPGAGKTIMTSIVIDDLTDRYSDDVSVGLAYIYFNFKTTAQLVLDDLLSSILKQLIVSQPSLPSHVKELCEQWGKKRRLPRKTILKALHDVIATYSRAFIVLDALDECKDDLSPFVEELLKMHEDHNVNIFATSRYIPEIQDMFSGNSVQLDIRASEGDVRSYLKSRIARQGTRALKKNDSLIIDKVLNVADGMFLLAKLHFESLKDKLTLKDIKVALESLVSGGRSYDSAYKAVMDRISEQSNSADSKNLAYRILSWITCAALPLTTSQLQYAISIELDESQIEEINQGASTYDFEFDPDSILEIEDMVSLCRGLVTIDEKGGTLRLVHYTAQEYFDRTRAEWFPYAHDDIAKICIISMSFKAPFDNDEGLDALQTLYMYSAESWKYHIRETFKKELCASATDKGREDSQFTGDIELMPLVLGFFRTERLRIAYVENREFVARFNRAHLDGYLSRDRLQEDYLAAYRDLAVVLAELSIHYDTGLLGEDRESIQEELLKVWLYKSMVVGVLAIHGVYLIATDYNRIEATALGWAVESGNEAILKKILDVGTADTLPNIPTAVTLLISAIGNGYGGIVEVLLNGVGLETKNILGRTLLSEAATRTHLEVLRVLLESGADIETRDIKGRTPLFLAIKSGRFSNIRFLLDKGADIEAKDNKGRTPLSVTMKYIPNADPFSVRDARVETKRDKSVVVSQSISTHLKRLESMSFMLSRGAGVGVRDKRGRTPLFLATEYGRSEDIKFLLEKGADIEAKDCRSRTPLLIAIQHDWGKEIRLLVEKGANIEARDDEGRTPLLVAAEFGKSEDVKFLLGKGANIEARDDEGRTPLLVAAEFGKSEDVKFLLGKGANIEVRDNEGRTPLLAAIELGRVDIIASLLDAGADVEAKDNSGRTSSSLAEGCSRNESIALMLGGADSSAKGSDASRGRLKSMAQHGESMAVKILLQQGVQFTLSNPLLEYLISAMERGQEFSKNAYQLLLHSLDPDLRNLSVADLTLMEALLDLAGEKSQEDFLEFLLEGGIDESDIAEAMVKGLQYD
ncbi:hypothetical protein TWF481_008798 [Arthrobotrys musiformis]|uniref:Nucleoside phosphorylase domain-containing protein n=1 Tax=Arthrobotrys musiformis TaxID=47236 RepID=A0AAV9WA43_9PEZI